MKIRSGFVSNSSSSSFLFIMPPRDAFEKRLDEAFEENINWVGKRINTPAIRFRNKKIRRGWSKYIYEKEKTAEFSDECILYENMSIDDAKSNFMQSYDYFMKVPIKFSEYEDSSEMQGIIEGMKHNKNLVDLPIHFDPCDDHTNSLHATFAFSDKFIKALDSNIIPKYDPPKENQSQFICIILDDIEYITFLEKHHHDKSAINMAFEEYVESCDISQHGSGKKNKYATLMGSLFYYDVEFERSRSIDKKDDDFFYRYLWQYSNGLRYTISITKPNEKPLVIYLILPKNALKTIKYAKKHYYNDRI